VIELERRREIDEIIRDAFTVWWASPGRFVLIAIAVIVPIEVAIFGLGLGQLTGPYDDKPTTQVLALEAGVSWLLTTPLLTAILVQALVAPESSTREAIVRGLELFVPAVAVTAMTAALVIAGLFVFILPGIFVAVRLAFVVEALVIDGVRGGEALRRSWQVTDRSFWRVLGISLGFYLVAGGVSALIQLPFAGIARNADAQGAALAGTVVGNVITLPVVVIAMTLLFFDLRARQAA
jgi:hypothetical protein